MSQIDSEVL